MIKSKSSSTLKTIIDINQINLNIIEWVKRIKKTVNQMTKKDVKINEWDENFREIDQKTVIFQLFQRDSSVDTS
jgi:hypothetical protein